MRVEFFRDRDGFSVAKGALPDVQALGGLLTSDLDHPTSVRELVARLHAAKAGGDDVDATGNAFTVEASGEVAVVSFAIDDSIAPVRLPTLVLLDLLETWLAFLEQRAPQFWQSPAP